MININLLILEDDEIQRYFIWETLNSLEQDISLYQAETKQEALRIAKNTNIDLFLMDIELKEGNGIDFAREIREIEKYSFTYMIFISGYEEFEFKAFKEIKCYEFIRKPYRKVELEDVVKKILEGLESGTIPRTSFKEIILNENKFLKISPDDIYYIEAFNKGVKICFRNEDNEVERYISKRYSFKEIKETLDIEFIVQSHRSYMINTRKIYKVYKKKNSWLIEFKNIEDIAYISNKHKDIIMEKTNTPFG